MKGPAALACPWSRIQSVVVTSVFATLALSAGHGQCWVNPLSKHIPGDAAPGDTFGDAVALGEGVFAVGSPGHDDRGVDAGAVYVFDENGSAWVFGQKIQASDAQAFDRFGSSVAIDGDIMAVGAIGRGAGAVHLFRRSGGTWSQFQRIVPFDGLNQDRFGISVGLFGDRLAVGATGHDGVYFDEGAVYLYRDQGSSFGFEAKITASDAFFSDRFGRLALCLDRLAVSSTSHPTGSVYIFHFDGSSWSEVQKIVPVPGAVGDDFGASLSLDVEKMCVGAPGADVAGVENAGKAYVYRFNGSVWVQDQLIESPDPKPNAFFGVVQVFEETLVVGAPLDNVLGDPSGLAYVFHREAGVWVLDHRSVPQDAASARGYGAALALGPDQIVIGASSDPSSGFLAGSAYLASSFANEIRFSVDPTSAAPGTNIQFQTRYGVPMTPHLLGVVAVNGNPTFVPVFLSLFGSNGVWRLSFPMPSGASGVTLDLAAFGLNLCGQANISAPVTFVAL